MQHEFDIGYEIIRPKDTPAIDGLPATTRQALIHDGTYPPAFRIAGPDRRAVGFLRRELIARNRALAAGASPEELRELVRELVAQRAGGAA